MCDFSKGLKFCTCGDKKIKYRKQTTYRKVKGEMLPIPNKNNDEIPLVYIWHLWKHKRTETELCMVGLYDFPEEDLGDGLNVDWIALNLNVEHCFDFDFTPSEGDQLMISQNIECSPYLSFIFENGKWISGHHSPFTEITELKFEGQLKSIQS